MNEALRNKSAVIQRLGVKHRKMTKKLVGSLYSDLEN